MNECIPGTDGSRHDFSITAVDVSANATLIFKSCSACGISYRYVDQVWEEIATEHLQ